MSKWLSDGEVLEGQGSGEAVPVSPRPQSLSPGTPRLSKGRSPVGSPTLRKAASPQSETMGKAKQLFALCDKEGKGFITKRDMQRLQMELPLSPEQLESVFDSLDRQCNGFVTPLEFSAGLGELMGTKDTVEQSQELAGKETDQADWSEDAATMRLSDILNELGIDKVSDSQQELCSLWCELQREQPELLKLLEGILLHAVTHLQDSISERDSLEQALRRRESEHHQFVRSIYEEMESQIREEREKRLAQESIKEKQRGIQIEEELKLRDHELEITLSRQKQNATAGLRTGKHQATEPGAAQPQRSAARAGGAEQPAAAGCRASVDPAAAQRRPGASGQTAKCDSRVTKHTEREGESPEATWFVEGYE
ncbi:EF-hand calcium-binding domain-containing protein 4A isoform X2 [Syngnathus typhle]|uniref:EF-hand calcium-binding domain-containing protein 4A isoform X2 n=1 Tax=Syngnathus typhle TaxID=161592 RepID=UPI002A6A33A7|nr:EF-hand calcium-binding domain-containing protein 4A isoform X2 [Syngnathus typhle]